MRLIVVRTIVVIVSFIVPFVLDVISLLAPVFYLVACIFVVDNIAQVAVVLISFSVTLLRGSDAIGRVPAWALTVVRVLTLPLSPRSSVGCELVDDHPRSLVIMSWRAVDLFSLVLNSVEFLVDRP
jgi:hypothetical protein